MNVPFFRARIEALAPRIAALGVRPLAELLVELCVATRSPETVLERVENFAALEPRTVRALGADRLPPRLSPVPRRSA